MKREIIRIDEDKCNGCGLCIPNCAEGALQIVNGKARLVAENLCDGLGACLGECPMDALHIEIRDADEFDEQAVHEFLSGQEKSKQQSVPQVAQGGGCPGSMSRVLNTKKETSATNKDTVTPSELAQWPVQLKLVNPNAPYFKNSDLLVAADCVPFAHADFHKNFLRNRSVAMGCPKLDDAMSYVEKLAELISINNLKSITVVYMEVPCCGGIVNIVREAVNRSGIVVPIELVKIALDGSIQQRQNLVA